jgi:maltooligosyltrehalose synthase
MKLNAGYKSRINQIMVPTVNEEYLIYQTLTGIWPMNQAYNDEFKDRLKKYFIKAMREAKTHSAWNEPEVAHEKAVVEFLFRILDPGSAFLQSFKQFHERMIGYGHVNSLVQLVLKMTCPGIPDIYQGTELWDLTLVDPDNRQPVDYEVRKDLLQNLVMRGKKDPGKLWQALLNHPLKGEVKLWLMHLLLGERKLNRELFLDGEYIPLEITGKFRENAIAFARKWKENRFIVVLPMHLADFREGMDPGIEKINWEDTSVHLGSRLSGNYLDILSRVELFVETTLQPRGFHRSDPFILLRSI